MMEVLAFLLVCLSTSAASAVHGSDMYVVKGFVMFVYAALLTVAAMLCLQSPSVLVASIIGVASSLVYWFVFRGGKQARAQIDATDTIGNPRVIPSERHDAYINAARSVYYIPVGVAVGTGAFAAIGLQLWWLLGAAALLTPLPFVSSWLCERYHYQSKRGSVILAERMAMQRKGIKIFWDVRRHVEAGTGLLLSGPCIAVIIISVCYVWEAING